MTLQQKTLNRYRQLFPHETLKATSERTGIQVTRVFRLFTGKTMKVKELEALNEAIQAHSYQNPSFKILMDTVENASTTLTNIELEKISNYIEKKVTSRSYGRFYIQSATGPQDNNQKILQHLETANIA